MRMDVVVIGRLANKTGSLNLHLNNEEDEGK
jgi:hypothetical protein